MNNRIHSMMLSAWTAAVWIIAVAYILDKSGSIPQWVKFVIYSCTTVYLLVAIIIVTK